MRKGQNVPKDYIRKKKKWNVDFFFPLSAETNFISAPSPPHSWPLSLPLPSFFPSFLLFQVLGFFSLAWLGPKAQKRRFRKRLGRAQGPFVCFGTRGRKSCPAWVTAAPSRKRQCSPVAPAAARPAAAAHGGDAGRADQGPARVPASAPPQKEGRGAEKERVLPADRTG